MRELFKPIFSHSVILIFTDILPKEIGRIRMKDASNQTDGSPIESQPLCKDDHDQRMHILLENFIKDKSCLSEFEMSLAQLIACSEPS